MSRDETYAFVETVNEIKSAQREGFRFRDIFHERSPKPPPKVVAHSGLAIAWMQIQPNAKLR